MSRQKRKKVGNYAYGKNCGRRKNESYRYKRQKNKKAKAYESIVLATMNELRKTCDEAEKLTAREYWPMPDYGELLFGIRE